MFVKIVGEPDSIPRNTHLQQLRAINSIRITAPEVREPVESVVFSNHQAADFFETWKRHVERIVDEDEILHAAEFVHGVEFLLQHIETGERQGSRASGVITEGALERAASRGPGLQRRTAHFSGEGAPVDEVFVE